jgi:hypothetical protein
MAYDIKDVFYLDVSVAIANATGGGGSAQLELSAYIDPIARGRQKGTGLAVYKVHWSMVQTSAYGELPTAGETGVVNAALIAGLGTGNQATGDIAWTETDALSAPNSLVVASAPWYGPGAGATGMGQNAGMWNAVQPSEDVPYVIVRDNVCLAYEVEANLTVGQTLGCRLEVAQISLDQATLNQLLRTQTV